MTAIDHNHASVAPGFALVPILLRIEGAVALAAAVAAFAYLGFSWWLFAVLILAPDLAMVGYLRGNAAGAWLYDLAHTYVFPALLAVVGYLAGLPLLLGLAAVWVAHIGADRALGYGLKFPGNFKDNHLTRLSVTGR